MTVLIIIIVASLSLAVYGILSDDSRHISGFASMDRPLEPNETVDEGND